MVSINAHLEPGELYYKIRIQHLNFTTQLGGERITKAQTYYLGFD